MNGVPNSPLNRYNQVLDARIENNVFVDVKQVVFGAGADAGAHPAAGQEHAWRATSSWRGRAGGLQGHGADRRPDLHGQCRRRRRAAGGRGSGFETRAIGRETLPDGRVYPDAAARKALGLKEPVKLLAREQTGVSLVPEG
jgi:poly(beta-D-mannuronate) lyase